MIFEDCALSPDAIESGRWCRHPRYGFEWRIASTRKASYAKRLRELQEPHLALLAAAPRSDEAERIRNETVRRAVGEKLVTDWRGMEQRVGGVVTPMPFSTQAVVGIMLDTRFEAITEWVINRALDDDRMTALAEATDAGNSGAGSAGD